MSSKPIAINKDSGVGRVNAADLDIWYVPPIDVMYGDRDFKGIKRRASRQESARACAGRVYEVEHDGRCIAGDAWNVCWRSRTGVRVSVGNVVSSVKWPDSCVRTRLPARRRRGECAYALIVCKYADHARQVAAIPWIVENTIPDADLYKGVLDVYDQRRPSREAWDAAPHPVELSTMFRIRRTHDS